MTFQCLWDIVKLKFCCLKFTMNNSLTQYIHQPSVPVLTLVHIDCQVSSCFQRNFFFLFLIDPFSMCFSCLLKEQGRKRSKAPLPKCWPLKCSQCQVSTGSETISVFYYFLSDSKWTHSSGTGLYLAGQRILYPSCILHESYTCQSRLVFDFTLCQYSVEIVSGHHSFLSEPLLECCLESFTLTNQNQEIHPLVHRWQ